MRYFFNPNANRVVKANGLSFRFPVTDSIGGVWQGVLSTDKPDELAALDAVIAAGGGIREITVERFTQELESKKKSTAYKKLAKFGSSSPTSSSNQQRPCGSCGRS